MDIYNILSLALSGIAILIPIISKTIDVFFRKPHISYYTNSLARLFFNQSGSYIRIDGVVESANKPASIKKIDVEITRKIDSQKLSLTWSTFISPMSQRLLGAISQSTQSAHPFRVDADNIVCAFIEFSDEFGITYKSLLNDTKELYAKSEKQNIFHSTYNEALKYYQEGNLYSDTKNAVKNYFFWEKSEYEIEVIISYLKNEKKTFKFKTKIDENNYEYLSANIDEVLTIPLKREFNLGTDFHVIDVKLEEV